MPNSNTSNAVESQTTWFLGYYFFGTQDIATFNQMRAHHAAFCLDPNVEEVLYTENPEVPNLCLMTVRFVRGHSQPALPQLRYLDRLYPYRPRSAHEIPKKPEQPQEYAWLKNGSWIQKDDRVYEVVSALYNVPVPTVLIRDWRLDRLLSMNLDEVLRQFSPTSKPRDPLTWHQRLLDDDEY